MMSTHHAGDSDKKARSLGRARRKPLKPLRRECRSFGLPVVTNSCVFHFTHEAAGAAERPAFPAPSLEGRAAQKFMQNSGVTRRENASVCPPSFRTARSDDPEPRDSGLDALHRPGMTIV